MYRNNAYDEDFSKDMRDLVARREYFLALVHDEDEPMSIEEALRFTIRRMGTVEFAALIKEKKQNVDKFLSGERHLKHETLNKYLRAFGLRIMIDVMPLPTKKAA